MFGAMIYVIAAERVYNIIDGSPGYPKAVVK